MSSYLVDGAGQALYGLELVGPIAARRPVFSIFGLALGQGIVGGSLTDFKAVGREAGALGLRVLRGEPLPASPVRSATTSAFRFDGRELARWQIDTRRLPANSEVLYLRPTLWHQYQRLVIGAIAVMVIQAGLIVALLVQRRRRREAQARLAEHFRFEALVTEIVTSCAAVPTEQIDEQIRDCLRRVATFLGVDRGGLWQPSSDGFVLALTHSWRAEGIEPPPATIDMRPFPYFRSRVQPGQPGVSFTRPDELPLEAAAERASFERGGVRSFAAIPVHEADLSLGVLTFVSVRAERVWSENLVQQLQTLAEHFSHAMIRARSAVAVETSAAIAGAVLAALPGETAIIDSTGTILQTNEAWAAAARSEGGSGRALSVGANYLDACRDGIDMPADVAARVQASIESILRGERDEFALEYPSSRQGEDRWLEVRVRRLARLGGGAAVMRFDVTARRQAEAAARRHLSQIAHLDRVAAMGHLASSLAHELNQPLTAILTNAQVANRLLDAKKPDLGELRATLSDIVSDDMRAAGVIRRARELLRKTEFKSLPLALNDLVANTLGLVSNDALLHSVSIEFRPAPTLPVVYGDLVQIQQVILNLLTNAIAAATGGVSVTRKVMVWTAVVTPPYIELGVQDSGKGIADKDLGHLFEPFFTTKSDGLGMGLAISRTIVEAHGGRLMAENAPAGGAIFRVHLRTDRPDTT
jgi:signal transduction histidine kinase